MLASLAASAAQTLCWIACAKKERKRKSLKKFTRRLVWILGQSRPRKLRWRSWLRWLPCVAVAQVDRFRSGGDDKPPNEKWMNGKSFGLACVVPGVLAVNLHINFSV